MEPNELDEARERYARLLDESLSRIVSSLAALEEVKRVSVFGSYAAGRRDLLTDLDIVVVMDTAESYVDRLRRLYSMLSAPVDLDLFCYTPAEWESLRETPFLRHVEQQERVLYEKTRA